MVIFITGISSGFGKSMAQMLSINGHKVYGTYRKEGDRLEGVTYLKADVNNLDDIDSAVKAVLEKEGKIDVFINNAGMGIGGPIEFSKIKDIENQMNVNWLGFIKCLHHILPIMRKQNEGKIICMSSIGGLMGLPFQGFYSASKFAIEGTAEALRLELEGTNIKVVVIEPGDFNTGFTSARKRVDNPSALSAYPSYKRYLECYENDELRGLKPEYLSKKIVDIVNCKSPKYHYIIATPLQKLSVYLKRVLPSKLFACIFANNYKR